MEEIEKCYNENEVYRRLRKAYKNIWYLNILSQKDVTKIELIRQSKFVDAMNVLNYIIESL